MKIVIIHNHYLQSGGEDEVVKAEGAMLKSFGHDVVLHERTNRAIDQFSAFSKLKFFLKDACWSKNSYRTLRQLLQKERPDLVHIHNTFLMMSPSVYQACFDERVPIVQTLHNYRFLCPIGVFYRNGQVCEDCLTKGRKSAIFNRCWKDSFFLSAMLKKIVDRFYERGILTKMIDRFIVLSRFSKNKYVQNGFDESKFTVKANFLSFDPGCTDFAGDYGLYVGGLQPYKGIDTLLKAWTKTSESFSLKIIGDGPLKEKVAKSVNNRIEYLGQKPLKDVIEYIKKARFVVFPSECYENFPRIIAEAFACGVGVIAGRLGAMGELVADGQTGLLFEPANADDLALKMNRLIDDAALAKRLGQNARQEFVQKYTQDKNYAALLKIYQDVVKNYRERSKVYNESV